MFSQRLRSGLLVMPSLASTAVMIPFLHTHADSKKWVSVPQSSMYPMPWVMAIPRALSTSSASSP